MRKTTGILAVVLAAAAAYTGASWYVGTQAQHAIEQAVAEANLRMSRSMLGQSSKGPAALVIAEYRRHVFSTDVMYALRIAGEPGEEYLLSDHMQHGPFPLGALRSGKFVPMMAWSQSRLLPSASTQSWFDSLGGQSPATGRTEVRFGGKAETEWNFMPLSVATDTEILKFSGANIRAVLSNQFSDSAIIGTLGLLDTSKGPGTDRLVIEDLHFDYETRTSGNDFQLNATTHARALKLELAEAGELALQDATMVVASDRKQDLGSGHVRYDFGHVLSNGVDLGSVKLGVSAKDFSMPALDALTDVFDDLNARYGSEDDWELSPQDAALLQQKLIGLLAGSPAIDLDPVVWRNDRGESSLSLALTLVQPPQADMPVSLDILLPQAVQTLDLKMRVERAMLTRAIEQLSAGEPEAAELVGLLYDEYASRLQTAGLATVQDGAAFTHIAYRDGEVDSNGRQMKLPEFLQRALMVFLF